MSAKAKKPTKAELARIKKEEDDRLIKEEDERIFKEKAEAKLKILRHDILAQERENREKLNSNRLQYGDYTDRLLNKVVHDWADRCTSIQEESRWNKFMTCDPKPDFQVDKNIAKFTTWLSLEKSRIMDNVKSLNSSSNQIRTCLDSLTDLMAVFESYDAENTDEASACVYQDMKEVVQSLLDYSTLEFLKNASSYKDDDSGNVQLIEHGNLHDIYLWGNLANNPRLKTIDFGNPDVPSSSIQMNLLKGMHSRHIAVRVVRKNYDTTSQPGVSSSCATSECETPTRYDLTPCVSEKDPEESSQSVGDDADRRPPGQTVSELEDEHIILFPENPDRDALVAETLAKEQQDIPVEDTMEGMPRGESRESTVQDDGPEMCETPPALDSELTDLPPDYYSLNDYAITGGTWDFKIFEIPPQSKKCGKWVIRRVHDDEAGLNNVTQDVIHKAASVPSNISNSLDESKTDEQGERSDVQTEIATNLSPAPITPPTINVNIKMFIPADQVILSAPEVAIWDTTYSCWRSEGISNIAFNETTRALSFTTTKLGKFAALQDRKLDLPYQSWEISPAPRNTIEFTILANYTEMKLQLCENNEISIVQQIHEEMSGTSVVQRDSLYSIAESAADVEATVTQPNPLRSDSSMKPNEYTGDTAVACLKQQLSSRAIFLFPSLHQPCSITKHKAFERLLYQQMAIVIALRMAKFTYSPVTATQIMPQEEEEVQDQLKPTESKASIKPSSATLSNDDGEEEESRPASPVVTIPVKDDPSYKPIREFEMVIKYSNHDDLTPQFSSSNSLSSFGSASARESPWRYMFARYPNGPYYRLALQDTIIDDDDGEDTEIIFSRKKMDESHYHYDLIHAIAADFNIDFGKIEASAQKLDLVYVKTIEDMLVETRILTNSV